MWGVALPRRNAAPKYLTRGLAARSDLVNV